MSRGIAALGSHELAVALDIFEQVVLQAPSFAEGHNKRATCLYLMQRYQDSIDSCKVGGGPGWVRGGGGWEGWEGAHAPACCPHALQWVQSGTCRCSVLPAAALRSTKRLRGPTALPHPHPTPPTPQLAIDLNPYHFGAISGMGLCHVNLGQREEAISAFKACLQINPGLDTIKMYIQQLQRDTSS
jgi:tetratricopeptide (TPR) repeat protein